MKQTVRRVMSAVSLALLLSAQSGFAETRPVNINTATVAELTALKGIGEVKAQAIVDYRDKNGGFKSIDDLKSVSGIGDKLIEQLRSQVTIGSAEKSEPAKKP